MTVELKDIGLDHPDVFCAVAQFQHAGYLPQKSVFDALTAQNIPKELHPKPPSDHVCLGRAMKGAASRNDRVETIGDGWVLTIVHPDKLDLEDPDNDGTDAHEVAVTAKIIKVDGNKVLRITPEDSPHAPLIKHEFEYQQDQFKASADISLWLCQTIIPWAGGVAARSRGGTYFVMRGVGLDRMRRVKDALDSVSTFQEREFPMLDDPNKSFKLPFVTVGTSITLKPEFAQLDAMRIILNGIIEESDKTCDELDAKLKGKLKKRGLKTQIAVAEELEKKLDDYAKALGLDLQDLTERAAELKAGLGVALLHEEEL